MRAIASRYEGRGRERQGKQAFWENRSNSATDSMRGGKGRKKKPQILAIKRNDKCGGKRSTEGRGPPGFAANLEQLSHGQKEKSHSYHTGFASIKRASRPPTFGRPETEIKLPILVTRSDPCHH